MLGKKTTDIMEVKTGKSVRFGPINCYQITIHNNGVNDVEFSFKGIKDTIKEGRELNMGNPFYAESFEFEIKSLNGISDVKIYYEIANSDSCE